MKRFTAKIYFQVVAGASVFLLGTLMFLGYVCLPLFCSEAEIITAEYRVFHTFVNTLTGATESTTQPSDTMSNESKHIPATIEQTMVWIYPGPSACSALSELSDGRTVDIIKPEYLTLDETGQVSVLTSQSSGCNGYSLSNIEQLHSFEKPIYTTLSGNTEALHALITDESRIQQAVTAIVDFVVDNNLAGAEIDIEGFGSWSTEDYQGYLHFLTLLGTTLHEKNKKIMVDIPPIGTPLEQSYYLLTYQDIAQLPVDFIVVMAYDYQYDYGVGTPIAPHQWVENVVHEAQKYISTERLVIGIPSYGYFGPTGSYSITKINYDEMEKLPGFTSATRDSASSELMWSNDTTSYALVDTIALNDKKTFLQSLGVTHISVWSLGGNNPWF